MAAPNVVNVTSIYGKTKTQAATTGAVTLLANAASSHKLLKVNTVIAANTDTVANYWVTLTYNDGATNVDIAQQIVIPAKASLIIIDKSSSLYMEEGHTIQVLAENADIELTISYEEIDDA
jgi:hypothetical protein